MPRLFLENKIDRQHQKDESDEMIASKGFAFKHQNGKKRKND